MVQRATIVDVALELVGECVRPWLGSGALLALGVANPCNSRRGLPSRRLRKLRRSVASAVSRPGQQGPGRHDQDRGHRPAGTTAKARSQGCDRTLVLSDDLAGCRSGEAAHAHRRQRWRRRRLRRCLLGKPGRITWSIIMGCVAGRRAPNGIARAVSARAAGSCRGRPPASPAAACTCRSPRRGTARACGGARRC